LDLLLELEAEQELEQELTSVLLVLGSEQAPVVELVLQVMA
jgi:hypothetical protein